MPAADPTIGNSRSGGPWTVIAVMTLVLVVDGLDASIVQVALPEMSRDLGMGVADGAFVVVAYILPLAGLCIPLSRIAEGGRVCAFLRAGILVFTVSSVACAASDDRTFLVAARFVQGIGAALMVSVVPSMATGMLPEDRRHMGMAYMNAAGCVAIVLGPSVGGVITGLGSWHWIFLINVPIGIAAMAMSLRLPRDSPDGPVRVPEPARAASMLVAVSTGMVALELWTSGEMLPAAAVLGAVCVLSMAAYCRLGGRDLPRRLRLVSPPVRSNRTYYVLALVFLVNTMVGAGAMYLLPYYLTGTAGYDTLMAGILLSVATTVSAVVSLPAGRWCKRSGCRVPASVSLGMRVVFCTMLAFVDPSLGLVYLLMELVVMGASFGISGTAQTTRMVERVDEEDRGSASAAVIFTNYIGNALGVAVFALVFKLVTGDLGSDIGVMDGSAISEGLHWTSLLAIAASTVCLIISLRVADPERSG